MWFSKSILLITNYLSAQHLVHILQTIATQTFVEQRNKHIQDYSLAAFVLFFSMPGWAPYLKQNFCSAWAQQRDNQKTRTLGLHVALVGLAREARPNYKSSSEPNSCQKETRGKKQKTSSLLRIQQASKQWGWEVCSDKSNIFSILWESLLVCLAVWGK